MKNLIKEMWKYGQVRFIAMFVGMFANVMLVDVLGLSGFQASLIYIPVFGLGTFFLHKWRGAKF